MARTFLLVAAISGLLAVALGAFGAHGLKAHLSAELLAVYQTGVQYHFYHTFALLAVALLSRQLPASRALYWSGWLFILGLLLFSGSLYLLAVFDARKLGIITPIGGLSFMAGWLALFVGVWRSNVK